MIGRLEDAARVRVGYFVESGFDGSVTHFSTLDGVREFVRETGERCFYAYDLDDDENIIKIKAIYMDRYRERDIVDRLLANKGGGQFVQTF